ncbi:cupredoxin domain-containing protein [Rickettsia helvetica]|uniref:Cupredoxin-1 domain-containing protein n=1 Tax=Rickettsia helvetica TaxID=35789 RepID=A0ABP0T5B1_RICHE|nr:cupredoxin domain-containing protein [Rickettsia helvetica]MCZ6884555.1 cupredoxin domain-containing protein [Rickettsia endosymbiont of Ixodes ricinus]MCZ6896882.1 cupredoxin domain-containing protein [Rickettsia endosymbiont of Ixodes ricinus]
MEIIKKNIIIIIVGLIFLATIIYISINKSSDNKTNNNILEVKIAIKDHKFVPNIVEVPKSTKIRLIVHNEDDTVEEFESHDLHREKIVMPNESINIILAPLNPGKYEFFGDFHQDTAQGFIIVND